MRSPWRDTRDLAEEFRFKDRAGNISPRAAQEFLARHKVPVRKQGRKLLVHVEDVLKAMPARGRQPRSERA